VRLHRHSLHENLAQRHSGILERALTADSVAELRGSPPAVPDLLVAYVIETFRALLVIQGMAAVQRRVRRSYWVLLVGSAVGIVGLALSLAWEASRPAVVGLSVGVLFSHVFCACVVRHQEARLHEYEETT